MIRTIACALATMAPLPALALSCLPHSVEATFQHAAKAEESYVVVQGLSLLHLLRCRPATLCTSRWSPTP